MKKATMFLFAILIAMMIPSVQAVTTTSTTAYTYFTYYEGLPVIAYVYWNTDGEITSLDTEDRFRTFTVLLRGEFFTDTSCSSYSHARPTCTYGVTGTPNSPLYVGLNLHVGDSWFIGVCEPDMGYRSFSGSRVEGASSTVIDTDCGAANCEP